MGRSPLNEGVRSPPPPPPPPVNESVDRCVCRIGEKFLVDGDEVIMPNEEMGVPTRGVWGREERGDGATPVVLSPPLFVFIFPIPSFTPMPSIPLMLGVLDEGGERGV